LQYRLVLPANAFVQLAGKLQEAAENITKLRRDTSFEIDKDQSLTRHPESSATTSSPQSSFP
jgi:hypothetical protein